MTESRQPMTRRALLEACSQLHNRPVTVTRIDGLKLTGMLEGTEGDYEGKRGRKRYVPTFVFLAVSSVEGASYGDRIPVGSIASIVAART